MDAEKIARIQTQMARVYGAPVTPGREKPRSGVTGQNQGAFRSPPGTPSGGRDSEPAAEARGGGPKILKETAGPAPLKPAAPERSKPNRAENELMMNLMVLRNTLVRNAPAARERAKRAGKWVWRDLRILLALVSKTQRALLRTMPESREAYYTSYAEWGHYELVINGPVRPVRHVLITDKHLGTVCDLAMRSECLMCIREGAEIGQCPLREALLEVAPPTTVQDGRWRRCEYREAAGNLIKGEEVTI